MHGNVLVNSDLQRIYYTTYEGIGGTFGRVKIYTYQKHSDGSLSRIEEKTLSDDALGDPSLTSNPRVGADIDDNGNIAVSFGQFPGYMVTHVYNASTEEWTMHRVMHYTEGLNYGDTNYYPYVRIKDPNDIRIVAKQDSSYLNGVNYNDKLWFQYIRYFRYNGTEWNYDIIHDIRDASNPKNTDNTVLACDLYLEGEDTHIIVKDNKNLIHYIVSNSGEVKERNIGILNNLTVNFLKITGVNDKKYYVASGIGYDISGFQLTGYVAVYDFDSLKLIYRNNDICKTPFISIAKQNSSDFIDIMTISRDKNYEDNIDTNYLKLKLA